MDDGAFLQAICADPDADGPRLLYADFLDENPDPESAARAEFIRVQCALAAAEPSDPVLADLGEREAALLTDHWRDWLKPACQALAEPTPVATGRAITDRYALNWCLLSPRQVPAHWITQATRESPPYFHSGQFRRGFLAHVALASKPHKSAGHVARLFERAPVDGCTFNAFTGAELGQTLRALPADRLRVLELIGCPTDAVLAVARSEKLRGLRDLVVMGAVGPDIGDELGRSTAFPGLRTLVLHHCGLDAAGVVRLCEAPFAGRLERLELTGCQMTGTIARALVGNFPETNRLGYLALTQDAMDNRTVRHLRSRFGELCDFTERVRDWPSRFFG